MSSRIEEGIDDIIKLRRKVDQLTLRQAREISRKAQGIQRAQDIPGIGDKSGTERTVKRKSEVPHLHLHCGNHDKPMDFRVVGGANDFVPQPAQEREPAVDLADRRGLLVGRVGCTKSANAGINSRDERRRAKLIGIITEERKGIEAVEGEIRLYAHNIDGRAGPRQQCRVVLHRIKRLPIRHLCVPHPDRFDIVARGTELHLRDICSNDGLGMDGADDNGGCQTPAHQGMRKSHARGSPLLVVVSVDLTRGRTVVRLSTAPPLQESHYLVRVMPLSFLQLAGVLGMEELPFLIEHEEMRVSRNGGVVREQAFVLVFLAPVHFDGHKARIAEFPEVVAARKEGIQPPAPNAPVPADIKEHAAGGSLRLRNGIADILFRVSRRIKSLNRNICRMGG